MNNHENQKSEMKKTQFDHDLADQVKSSVDESRRGFTKSGLALSGVLLTLASRPILGDVVCKSPSGFLSGNVSASGTVLLCSGLSPGYWGEHPESWLTPYEPGSCTDQCNQVANWTGGTPFCSVFSCGGYAVGYSGKSMMQVIHLLGNQDKDQLGAHIVSALLNARSGYTPVLTETQVINMFNEWAQYGYFKPTASVKWYGADIVEYITSTFG